MSSRLAAHLAEAPDGVLVVPAEAHAARAGRLEAKLARLDPGQLAAIERIVDQLLPEEESHAE